MIFLIAVRKSVRARGHPSRSADIQKGAINRGGASAGVGGRKVGVAHPWNQHNISWKWPADGAGLNISFTVVFPCLGADSFRLPASGKERCEPGRRCQLRCLLPRFSANSRFLFQNSRPPGRRRARQIHRSPLPLKSRQQLKSRMLPVRVLGN